MRPENECRSKKSEWAAKKVSSSSGPQNDWGPARAAVVGSNSALITIWSRASGSKAPGDRREQRRGWCVEVVVKVYAMTGADPRLPPL